MKSAHRGRPLGVRRHNFITDVALRSYSCLSPHFATTKPHSVRDTPRGERRFFSLLTPLPSLLAFGRSGLFGPPLCGGSAPATPPLNLPPQPACGNMTLTTRCDRASPPTTASWLIPTICQRRPRRRGDARLGPTYTAMTIASPLQKHGRSIPPRQAAHGTHTERGFEATDPVPTVECFCNQARQPGPLNYSVDNRPGRGQHELRGDQNLYE